MTHILVLTTISDTHCGTDHNQWHILVLTTISDTHCGTDHNQWHTVWYWPQLVTHIAALTTINDTHSGTDHNQRHTFWHWPQSVTHILVLTTISDTHYGTIYSLWATRLFSFNCISMADITSDKHIGKTKRKLYKKELSIRNSHKNYDNSSQELKIRTLPWLKNVKECDRTWYSVPSNWLNTLKPGVIAPLRNTLTVMG